MQAATTIDPAHDTVVDPQGFVLFVEDNDDLRESFVELIRLVLEHRCIGARSYDEVVALVDRFVAGADAQLRAGRPPRAVALGDQVA